MIRVEMGNDDLVGDCDDYAAQEARDHTAYLFEMPDDPVATQPCRAVNITLPRKLQFLMKLHRFKVIHGGRGGGKSWAVADAILALGAAQKLRILCAREVQKSIEQSVHQLLKDRIVALGLEDFYKVQDTKIIGGNGTLIVFSGLGEHTITSIKSFEGIDIVWVEEAQSVSKKSWDILIPTIRKEEKDASGKIIGLSEIWVTFNPDMETDDTWKRFVLDPPVDDPPFDCVVTQLNYTDNKNFPEVLERERKDALRRKTKEDYENIWLGVCRTSVVGAIYAREMAQMALDRRCLLVPYDPRLQVHFIWDLGWNDAMTVGVVQKPTPSTLAFINYFEDSFQRYDEVVERLRGMRYSRWGWHWLPHDGDHKNPQTGMSPRQILINLRCRVKPVMQRTSPEARIKAAREVFPRVLIDSTDRTQPGETGYIGGARLLEVLRRYSRVTPKTTDEPKTPKHDQFSHGADMFGAACEIADKIIDDEYVDRGPPVPEYDNSGNPGMGLLGG